METTLQTQTEVTKINPSELSFERRNRIKIFLDTLAKTEGIDDSEVHTVKLAYCPKTTLFNTLFDNKTEVEVVNEDCIMTARKYAKLGKVCILNMANDLIPGGGVERGSMAQEEELCRKSDLYPSLNPRMYPLQANEFIYTENITFFKGSRYRDILPFKVDVLTIAAPNLRDVKKDKGFDKIAYAALINYKLDCILNTPALKSCEYLVLSAFGCGAFKNNPEFIAKQFKKALENNKHLPYKKIIFSIIDDKNGNGNFETFKKILN